MLYTFYLRKNVPRIMLYARLNPTLRFKLQTIIVYSFYSVKLNLCSTVKKIYLWHFSVVGAITATSNNSVTYLTTRKIVASRLIVLLTQHSLEVRFLCSCWFLTLISFNHLSSLTWMTSQNLWTLVNLFFFLKVLFYTVDSLTLIHNTL